VRIDRREIAQQTARRIRHGRIGKPTKKHKYFTNNISYDINNTATDDSGQDLPRGWLFSEGEFL
jgi:hypothetical protein